VTRRAIIASIGLGALWAGLALGSAAAADNSPFTGRWHWNRTESVLPPGEPVPADMTADIRRVDSAHVQWSITVTDAQGRPAVETFDSPANGEFYPISSDTTASFRLTEGSLQAVFKGPAGQSDTLTCTLSANHKKMTCNGTLSEEDGKAVGYVDVFDRK